MSLVSAPERESEEADECEGKAYYTAQPQTESDGTVACAKRDDNRKEIEPLPDAEGNDEHVASALRPWAVGSDTADDRQHKACPEPDGVKGNAQAASKKNAA